MKKLSFIVALLCASMMAWAVPTPSGQPFGTYQVQNQQLYANSGGQPGEALEASQKVNLYIVDLGSRALMRAIAVGSTTFDNPEYSVQMRIWNAAVDGFAENWLRAHNGGNTNYHIHIGDANQPGFTDSRSTVNINCYVHTDKVTPLITYQRGYINNPIDDTEAPVLDAANTVMVDDGTTLTFTFGSVTADDEYFYYVIDEEHEIADISLDNTIAITKPTIEDGSTYTFKCYAVDFNGNLSNYKEISLVMPFDPAVDLALNKHCTAGAVQDANYAQKAVDGDASTFWTCFGQGDASTTWWKVDLGNVYDLDSIMIHFNDIAAPYNILASVDGSNWNAIVTSATASSQETKLHPQLLAIGQYLKVTSTNNSFGIKEFEVYAKGIAAPDATNPTLSVSCTDKTVNSATLQIVAADKYDTGNDGEIASIIISGDNDFEEIDVLGELDGDNKVTLSGLKDNTTYHFTVTAYDKSRNYQSKAIEVVLPFNVDFDLAYKKSCKAGYSNGTDTPDKAVNGENDHWGTWAISDYSLNWWQVDLGTAYELSEIEITFATPNTYKIEISLDEDSWTKIVEVDAAPTADVAIEHTGLTQAARYIRLTALGENMVAIRHFKVYGTDYYTPADPGAPTSIDNINAGEKAVKVIENGQLVIIKNGVRYNVIGKKL